MNDQAGKDDLRQNQIPANALSAVSRHSIARDLSVSRVSKGAEAG